MPARGRRVFGRSRAVGRRAAICTLIICAISVSAVRYLGPAAAPVTVGNSRSHLQFPKYDVRSSQCGVEWQDTYSSHHRDILAGAVPQRFVVAVGVEQGLTGVSSASHTLEMMSIYRCLYSYRLLAGINRQLLASDLTILRCDDVISSNNRFHCAVQIGLCDTSSRQCIIKEIAYVAQPRCMHACGNCTYDAQFAMQSLAS